MAHPVRVRTATGWQDLALVGPPGPTGPAGPAGPVGAGSGDVNGPASAVADRIAVFNATTGKLIKDGGKTIAELTSGGGTPGGSTTQIQFNDAGAFGGDAGFTYNKTTDTATIGSLALANGGKVTTPGIGTFESTGGTYGTARMTLMMESGVAGATFETVPIVGAELVDFVFKTTGGQDNFRYERRTSECIASNNYEFQIGPPTTPHLRVGNTTLVSNKPLLLPANPVAALHAATKQYVDGLVGGGTAAATTFTPAGNVAATDVQAAIVEVDAEKLALAGGTMTGTLTLANGTAAAPSLNFAAGAAYGLYWFGSAIGFTAGGAVRLSIGSTATSTVLWREPDGSAAAPSYSFTNSTNAGLYRTSTAISMATGGVESMRWTASDNSTLALGALMVSANPTANLQVAPKQYVDARTPKITVATTAPSSPATNDIWVDIT